jgi:hypothetical protein
MGDGIDNQPSTVVERNNVREPMRLIAVPYDHSIVRKARLKSF